MADRSENDCAVARDADGDGHDAVACGGDDCDDAGADRFSGNSENCDPGHDEDCNEATVGGVDRDGDGAVSAACCNGGVCGGDCDGTTVARSPLPIEICDSQDNDCDRDVDEERNTVSWYPDEDGDGIGAAADPISTCEPQPGRSLLPFDSDDTDADTRPFADERCNGTDDDCDDTVDEGCDIPDMGPPDMGPPDMGPPVTYEIPRECSVDGDCNPDEICFHHRGAPGTCHRRCIAEREDAVCERRGTELQRRCLQIRDSETTEQVFVCTHACDNYAQLGCPSGSVCDVFVGGASGDVPYLECRLGLLDGMDGAPCSVDGYECAGGYTCVSGEQCRPICLVGDDSTCTEVPTQRCFDWSTPSAFGGIITDRCQGS